MLSSFRRSPVQLVSVVLLAISLLTVSSVQAAKNVIIMVGDGAGYNQWLAAEMYQGKVGKQVFDQSGWLHLSSATYPLNRSAKPTKNVKQDPTLVYDAAKAWDPTPCKKGPFAGYAYLKSTATDSAAAATAMASGQKTFNNSINWTDDNQPMTGKTIAEIAKARGKMVGVVTSVPWSHATPAAFGGAHQVNRNSYPAIANEMLRAPWLDVIMGAGNPQFDENGHPRKPKTTDFQYVGGKETWEQLEAGKHPAGWKLIQNKADFEQLASGSSPTASKVLGTVRVATTLQEKRGKVPEEEEKKKEKDKNKDEDEDEEKDTPKNKQVPPFSVPFNSEVPTLEVMSRAAIRVLEKNPQGFFLMIEGGAIDWANHANETDRVIEEQIDYFRAVEAVVAWVEKNSNWNDTLLILTTDHESGLLWGPNSDTVAFQPLEDRGPGQLPGMKYNTRGHANSLVPLHVRGLDAELFRKFIQGKDEKAAAVWSISGEYVKNTAIFEVMKASVELSASSAK